MDALARQRRAAAALWCRDVASRPEGDWAELEDLTVWTTGIAEVHWNGAVVRGRRPAFDEARQWFADREMPWAVLVPAELELVPPTAHVLDQRVMLRHLDDLPPLPDLALRWDAGEEASLVQAEAFEGSVELARVFVLPKLVNDACGVVVAYLDGVAAATATVVVSDGVAGVYGVGTMSRARRQGLGRAVTLAALHEARSRGCDLAFLNPSVLGYGVYAALGFRDAPPFRVYASP